MGCDIHGYVDYKINNSRTNPSIHHLGAFRIDRNYELFGVLAGVRGGQTPIVPQKGLPDILSWKTLAEASLIIIEDEDDREEGCCSRSDAERWGNDYVDDTKMRVWGPDWHSHSWLTTEELGKAIDQYCEIKAEDLKCLSRNEDGTWPDMPEGYKVRDDHGLPYDSKWKKEKAAIISKEVGNLKCPLEIAAIHLAMKSLEESGVTPRFIFWFDN